MAVKIRLARAGAKKAPFYRVVVADARAPRDGRFIEIVGRYNPRTEPSTVELDVAKVEAWLARGAQLTDAAEKLLAIAKGEKEPPTPKAAVSQKAAAKAEAAAQAEAAPAEGPASDADATPDEATVEDVAEAE